MIPQTHLFLAAAFAVQRGLGVPTDATTTSTASYTLGDDFSGTDFFSHFNFFTDDDPTHGSVKYVNQTDAKTLGLVSTSDSSVYIGVDHKNKAPLGRPSVRIASKKTYNSGLFILDLAHMPASTCGTWPSFWTWGDGKKWPGNGEIDIIEGIHTMTHNAMSLHTANGCSIDGTGSLGTVATKNCYVGAEDQSANAGCGINSKSDTSYGTPFNKADGGVYAMEWTDSAIRIWYWPRASVPSDVGGNSPNPGSWGTPQANFAGKCDIKSHFVDHRIILDTTFCGDWASGLWTSNPTCKNLADTCEDYVADFPSAFAESYWRINSLKVFKQ